MQLQPGLRRRGRHGCVQVPRYENHARRVRRVGGTVLLHTLSPIAHAHPVLLTARNLHVKAAVLAGSKRSLYG
jgi:hypothetical protein